MPDGPVIRPGAEAWHGGPSTLAFALALTRRFTKHAGRGAARGDAYPVTQWL